MGQINEYATFLEHCADWQFSKRCVFVLALEINFVKLKKKLKLKLKSAQAVE